MGIGDAAAWLLVQRLILPQPNPFHSQQLGRGLAAESTDGQECAPSIPVMIGMGVPMAERRHGIMFGHEGLGLLDEPEPVLRVREETGARDRIEDLAGALAEAEPDVLVAIGPLTNLGALAAAGIALPPVAVMGGRLQEVLLPGMSGEITEWNWHCDPLAVQRVLAVTDRDGGPPPTVIPAEVTFRTRLVDEDLERLADGDPLSAALAVLCHRWLATQRDRFGSDEPIVALHDPLTTAVLVEPGLCSYRDCRIEVDDGANVTEVDGEANIRIATDVAPEAARRHIMTVVTGAVR